MHGASHKDKGEGFELPKCIMCSRERRREQGALLKAEEWSFMPSVYAHVLKRPRRVQGALLKAKNGALFP